MTSLERHLLECVGNTPLVKIPIDAACPLYAKLEYLNPGGSIKDRAALYMVRQAEISGALKAGGTIIEASSGNQGIALSMIGALSGYKVVITVPKHTSSEKVGTMRAYGAEVIVCPDTDSRDDPTSYWSVARKLSLENPNSFMPNQYFNTKNPEAHYNMTGPEIWRDSHQSITHFICGMGSCGTISGVGRYLKQQNPDIKVVGVDSSFSWLSSSEPQSYETEGIGVDSESDNLDRSVIDQIIPVNDKDAFQTARRLAQQGYLVGPSSGAVYHVCEKYLRTHSSASDVPVCILADSGRAYLRKLFSEEALFQDE